MTLQLHHQIFLAILLGALFGAFTSATGQLFGLPVLPIYTTLGDLFLNALKMVVIPLVMTAIISSLVGLGQDTALGRLGLKTVGFYFLTSLVAVLIGVVLVNLITPGIVAGQAVQSLDSLAGQASQVVARAEGRSTSDFAQIILQIFPPNLIEAALKNQLLGLIVFSLLFGYYLRTLQGPAADTLRQMITASYEVMLRITLLIIRFAPLGVFGLIAASVANPDFTLAELQRLGWFVLTVCVGLAIHALVVMPLVLRFIARRSPLRHMQAMSPALLTAFSSASSAATLPLSLECTQYRAGVSQRISSFVQPLGATVNMDGTAMYSVIAVIFIAQIYAVELTWATQLMIVLVALFSSIGVAAVPSASLVAIILMLNMIGLPAEAIALIMVTDRVLDMLRTTVNVWGDSVGAVVIARSEGEQHVLSLPVTVMEAQQRTLNH
jgi:Na+/H+-dicarboxylate symporter